MSIQGISTGHLVVNTSATPSSAAGTSQQASSSSTQSSATQETTRGGPPPGGRPPGPPPGGGAGSQQAQGTSTTSSSSSSTDEIEIVARQIGVSAEVLRGVVQQLKSLGESADPLAGAIQHLQQVRQAQATGGDRASQDTSAAAAHVKKRQESFNQVARQVGVEPTDLRKALRSAIDQAASAGQSGTADTNASHIIGSAAHQLGVDPADLVSAIQEHDANLVSQYA